MLSTDNTLVFTGESQWGLGVEDVSRWFSRSSLHLGLGAEDVVASGLTVESQSGLWAESEVPVRSAQGFTVESSSRPRS